MELEDKEWEKLKETQELIFNTSAPSSVIVAAATDDTKTLVPPKSEELTSSPSKEKKHRKWSIFSRRGAKEEKLSENKGKSRKVSSTMEGATVAQSLEPKKHTGKSRKARTSQDKIKLKETAKQLVGTARQCEGTVKQPEETAKQPEEIATHPKAEVARYGNVYTE